MKHYILLLIGIIILLGSTTWAINAYAAQPVQIDGTKYLTIYPPSGHATTNVAYIVNIKQPPDSNTTPETDAATCTLTTTYPGAGGVKMEFNANSKFIPFIDGWAFNGGHPVYITKDHPYTFALTGRAIVTGQPEVPIFVINNAGCEITHDGDTCKHLIDTYQVTATVSCKYN